jgi:hypothetical protein
LKSTERGVALVIALMAMTMMIAIGTAVLLTAVTESRIARNFRLASDAMYSADAVIERAIDDLAGVRDWNTLLNGSARSGFADGMPTGVRLLPDGTALDLGVVVNLANCQKATPCSEDDMNRVTDDRPWGLNNPRWMPFAWGAVNRLTPTGSVNSPFYVMLMVGDDPSECDNNPFVDGGAPVPPCAGSTFNPGAGVVSVRAEAFGPFGTHTILEATLTRENGNAGVRMLSWREAR